MADIDDDLRAIRDFVDLMRKGKVRLVSTVDHEADGAVLVVRERLVKKRKTAGGDPAVFRSESD